MKERLEKLRHNFPANMDAVLVTSPFNRRYYTGFPSSAGVLLVTQADCYFVIDGRYYEQAADGIAGCAVVLKDVKNEYGQLFELLISNRVKRLGIESKKLTVFELETMRAAFAGVEIDTGSAVSDALAAQRAIKDPNELASMKAAQAIADKAFLHLLDYIKVGKTELQIAEELEAFCRRNGSESMAFGSTVASGRHSSSPHAEPDEKEVQAGDFVTLDYGCVVNGYCSDMTRTVAMGGVSDLQRECYETVLAAEQAAIRVIRDGIPCFQVDKTARDVIDAVPEFKDTFPHGLGHSIGLECHETPMCGRMSTDTLKAGMVTSVEPGIYLAGQFGVRIEDCVLVTGISCDNLCASTKELIIL